MKTLRHILTIAAFALLASSCRDLLLEKPPHIVTADQLYINAEGFQLGLNGIYSAIRTEREGLGYSTGFGAIDLQTAIYMFGTDNISTGNNMGNLHRLLYSYGILNSASDANLQKIFVTQYQIINAANTIIERAEKSDINWNINSVSHKARILAEAHTMRAWAYNNLITLWGPVPMNLQETSGTNIKTDLKRTPVPEIRRQIISDLVLAAENLPWYPHNSGSMSKGVALTYLTEQYLAINKPDSALYYANACIDGNSEFGASPYRLMTGRFGAAAGKNGSAFSDLFNPGSVDVAVNTESLWTIQWAKNVTGGGSNLMRHETLPYYQGASSADAFTSPQFNNKTICVVYTEERGGRGWGRSAILPYTFELYYRSSESTIIENLTSNQLQNLRYEDRGNEYILRKYFILTAADKIGPYTEGATTIGSAGTNSATGRPWAVGDTVWLGLGNADASVRIKSPAIDYRLAKGTSPSRQDCVHSLKYAYCDPGYLTATESHQNQIYLRLAETILLRAEANVRLGNPGGAADDINLLRKRAHALEVSASDFGGTLTEQLDFILDERTRELLLEEKRRSTLARMGGKDFLLRRIQQYNPKDGPNITLRDTVFPIPQTVIDANLTLKMPQNPGFPGAPGSTEELMGIIESQKNQ